MNTTTAEDSFISAWSKAQFPGENRTFVKSFCDEIGIAAFEYKPRSYSYIAATRRDGTGELRIHWGCTTGFTKAEARHFGAGADVVRVSSTRKKTWLVSHPEHRDVDVRGPGGGGSAKPTADMCPQCSSYELSISGVCPSCDDQ
jgi:hypothetical protein